MANSSSVSQLPVAKNTSERLIIAVDDVNNQWPALKEQFEARVPYKRALLNNKARNQVFVEKLPVEYILRTDARLRARLPTEQLPQPAWFRHPYATIVLVTCEDLDEYKNILKPRLKTIVSNEEREWFIVFVLKSVTDAANKLIKRVYSKLESDFSSKRRERCCKLDVHGADAAVWEDLESKIVECIRNTLDRRVQYYEEEVRKLSDNRFLPTWSFCNFLIVKESLAFMFEMACLQEDALREYDELEQIYLEIGNITDFAKTQLNAPNVKGKEFGGTDPGDNCAALLDGTRKPFTQFVHDGVVREFDFRQYLFSRQAQLLFSLQRPAEVAARGHAFIMTFSKTLVQQEKRLPFCLREVWVITACLTLVKATAQRFTWRTVAPDMEKDFYRLQADLYFYARTKLMRLADLIGYGKNIERSPCNSAALSMLPWPKPAVWPSVPPEASSRILAKEQAAQQEKLQGAPALRKQLSLSPSVLLREANRRRASLSAGNLSELLNLDKVSSTKESPAADGAPGLGPNQEVGDSSLPAPETARPTIDRPMNLPEIQAAAEHALLTSITDEQLRKSLSSAEDFEEFYLDLTRATADNFHRSWRKRHGVILDGEVAAVFFRRGALDAAAKLYEKVCALYASERWTALLAEVLPRLINCQRQLRDWSGYLFSCIKLLSLDAFLLSVEDRRAFQAEIIDLAHNVLKVPLSLDVSALITFAARGGAPLELCESDPGVLEVVVWSGFVDEVALESLSLTLMATFSADEGTQVVKSVESPVLKPGKNLVRLTIPPQRPGSYVLGVLTGHMGQVRLRSHTYCSTSAASFKGGSPESDDFLSYEKPLRPVLEVSQPRPLLEIRAVVARGLLLKEQQWVGIAINPLDYSLKGAVLHIAARPGLQLDPNETAELEPYSSVFPSEPTEGSERTESAHGDEEPSTSQPDRTHQTIEIKNGKLDLVDSASTAGCVVWVRVVADPDGDEIPSPSGVQPFGVLPPAPKPPLTRAFSSGLMRMSSLGPSPLGPDRAVPVGGTVTDAGGPAPAPVKPSLDGLENGAEQAGAAGLLSKRVGMRTLNVKMEFGASRSRLYERALSLHFTNPFRAATRTVTRGKDGSLLLQVTLKSQVEATLTIVCASLALQPGFAHVDNSEGRPSPAWLLPLTFSANAEGALLFVIRSDLAVLGKEGDRERSNGPAQPAERKSVLHVRYKIVGDRRRSAHALERDGSGLEDERLLDHASSFVLKMPVLEQLVSVGMLPVPSQSPRVGHQVVFQWRIERLKAGRATPLPPKHEEGANPLNSNSLSTEKDGAEELVYELKISEDSWMIAGRKKGRVALPQRPGAQVVISMACVPLVAGHVHPPALRLADIGRAHISHSPAGPHLVCVLPAAPCSALCVKKSI